MKSTTSLILEGHDTDDWLFFETVKGDGKARAIIENTRGDSMLVGGVVLPGWKPRLPVEWLGLWVFGPQFRSHKLFAGRRIVEVRVMLVDANGRLEQGVRV